MAWGKDFPLFTCNGTYPVYRPGIVGIGMLYLVQNFGRAGSRRAPPVFPECVAGTHDQALCFRHQVPYHLPDRVEGTTVRLSTK